MRNYEKRTEKESIEKNSLHSLSQNFPQTPKCAKIVPLEVQHFNTGAEPVRDISVP